VAKDKDILFRSEDSMWQLLKDGRRTWDARLHDISDDRIYRLSWGQWEASPPPGRKPTYNPVEPFVSFLNKDTGEILKFRFAGLEFVPWAPGWCFIQLGGLIAVIGADGVWRYPKEED
jgi:hypothetical protein